MPPELLLRDTAALQALARRQSVLPHIDPESIAAAQHFLRAAKRVLASFAKAFSVHGLSPGRYAVLVALDVHRPALSPSTIADQLGVTRATVTGLIDGLVRDGLVIDRPDGADRRSKAIALTSKGEALLDNVLPDIFARMATLTAPLSPGERGVVLRLLEKIEDGLHRPNGAEGSRP